MVNIKLGDKVYDGVESVKLDTAEGSTVDFAPYEETFAAGKAEGIEEGYTDGKAEGLEEGRTIGVEEGRQAEYDAFWDTYQQNGLLTDYSNAFAGSKWTNENFAPKYDIVAKGWSSGIFHYSKITDLVVCLAKHGVTIDTSEVTALMQAFQGAQIQRIPTLDMRKATENNNYAFGSVCRAETIDKLIVSENTHFSTSTFDNASYLKNITFEGVIGMSINFKWSYQLTTESVQSIIDHLKDLTGLTAQTVTFHATVGASLTEAQRATITAKNWTLVY